MPEDWVRLTSIEAKLEKMFKWFKHLEEQLDVINKKLDDLKKT